MCSYSVIKPQSENQWTRKGPEIQVILSKISNYLVNFWRDFSLTLNEDKYHVYYMKILEISQRIQIYEKRRFCWCKVNVTLFWQFLLGGLENALYNFFLPDSIENALYLHFFIFGLIHLNNLEIYHYFNIILWCYGFYIILLLTRYTVRKLFVYWEFSGKFKKWLDLAVAGSLR